MMPPDQAAYLHQLEQWLDAGYRPDEISLWILTEIHGCQEDLADEVSRHGKAADATRAERRYIIWLFGVAEAWSARQWPLKGPGRPRGPSRARDAASFELQLLNAIRKVEKPGDRSYPWRVAAALDMSRNTLQRYCRRFGIDYAEVRRRAWQAP
jgi:hypothetical protein